MIDLPSRRRTAPALAACAAALTLALASASAHAQAPVPRRARAAGSVRAPLAAPAAQAAGSAHTEHALARAAGSAQAAPAQLPAAALSGLRWRLIGPFRAGRALSAAGVPGNSSTFFFGAVAGGVWKTVNAGVTWEPIFDGQPIAGVGALAVAASDTNVIYVGTGEADMRSDITYGNGVYRTSDGGKTWQHVGLDDTRHIGRILIDPKDPNTVLVAALGHAYGSNDDRGVYRSTDGGETWTRTLFRNDSTGAVDLAWDPASPDVVYATLWNAHRTPWSQYPPDEGAGSGIWKSEDEGRTWTEITASPGLPSGKLGRIGVATAEGGRRVYAIIEATKGAGLYRSDDGGAHWRFLSDDSRITTRGWYFGRVFVDPSNPDIVYMPNRGIVRSKDGGRTLETIKGEPGGDDYHYVWIDPKDGTHIIQASDQGTNISLDDGATWSSWYNQPTAQFYHVVTDDRFPYWVYGAQQDAGTVGIASRSDYGQLTFRDWMPVGAGEAGFIAPDPADPDIIYGGDTYGAVYRFDRRTGQRQDISPTPATSFDTPMNLRSHRFTWTSPIVFDPFDPKTIYLGAERVLKTTDGGLHWTAASPDVTGATEAARKQAGPLTVENAGPRGHGVVYTIAPSPAREGVIWAGTDVGKIQLTQDGGKTWRDVTPPGLGPWSKISLIDAAHGDAATAYAAVDRHRLDDLTPLIYRTHDAGAHWTKITDGIPRGAFVRAVRADPVQPGLLYAGTELGVYVSFDDGARWQPLQLNLPTVPVRDLAIHGADLIAATHGRSFWVLDDVAPLRQLAAGSVAAEPFHLFAPEPAFRLRRSNNRDTPLPPEEPHGQNPPAGAILDWWLKDAAAGPATLVITDSAGDVVRTITGADTPPPYSEIPFFTTEWLPRPQPLTTHAGVNRFVWDLRYPRPPASSYSYSISAIPGEGTVAEPEGPLVAPGTFTVKLTIGGKTETRRLVVKPDPRVHVPDSVFAIQLAAAKQIVADMKEGAAAAREIAPVRARLDSLRAAKLPADAARRVEALAGHLSLIQPAALADRMGGLLTVVEGADRVPPDQVRVAYTNLHARLGVEIARWNHLKRTELPGLDAALKKAGVRGIEVARGQ